LYGEGAWVHPSEVIHFHYTPLPNCTGLKGLTERGNVQPVHAWFHASELSFHYNDGVDLNRFEAFHRARYCTTGACFIPTVLAVLDPAELYRFGFHNAP
jgi:hypothetical protein